VYLQELGLRVSAAMLGGSIGAHKWREGQLRDGWPNGLDLRKRYGRGPVLGRKMGLVPTGRIRRLNGLTYTVNFYLAKINKPIRVHKRYIVPQSGLR
jgi:hypothetical protein